MYKLYLKAKMQSRKIYESPVVSLCASLDGHSNSQNKKNKPQGRADRQYRPDLGLLLGLHPVGFGVVWCKSEGDTLKIPELLENRGRFSITFMKLLVAVKEISKH